MRILSSLTASRLNNPSSSTRTIPILLLSFLLLATFNSQQHLLPIPTITAFSIRAASRGLQRVLRVKLPILSSPSSPSSTLALSSRRRPVLPVPAAAVLPSLSMSTMSTESQKQCPTPPIAKREEDRFVYAGVLPASVVQLRPNNENNNDDKEVPAKQLIRQSESSTNALLNPPRPIPDPYGWLRDESRSNSDVLAHLHAENEYTNQMTNHLSSLRKTLNEEMISSIQETDYTTLVKRDGKFWYYTRTNQGESYTIYCRAPITSSTTTSSTFSSTASGHMNYDDILYPQIHWNNDPNTPILPNEHQYLNVNTLAQNQSYCSVTSVSVSPKTHDLLAYGVDYKGDEIYKLHVENLVTGEVIIDSQKEDQTEIYSLTWGGDDKENVIFYVKMDDAHRPFQVYRKVLKYTNSSEQQHEEEQEDELIFEQLDDLYWTSISKSSDYRYLFIETSSSETSEVYYLDLKDDTGNATLKCIATKKNKVLYDVDHYNGYWIVTSNIDKTPNMRLMSCKVGEECGDKWVDMISKYTGEKLFDGGYHRSLDGVDTFENYLVASGREGGLPRVWVLEPSSTKSDDDDNLLLVEKCTQLTFDETAYDVGVGSNYNYNTEKITLYYDSLTTPLQSLEVLMSDPNNKEKRKVLKQKFVPGYNKEDYGCERITVKVRDGTEVPVSMVYRKDFMEKHVSSGETMPVHLVGYGSYGACSEADFSATRLSLLNRGIIYVTAHVRGGGEMGRNWYEEPNGAKYLCKKNTFNDFCDVAKWLLFDKKLTTPPQLSCEGRSAGGLLIGASINQAPELFGVAILGVPFVDVVCTMTDSSIPLTCGEWEEWGNPNEEKYFDYMMEYSPINNVQKGKKYPACLLTGGLHDPRVQYWEPAKFAAELRHQHDKEASGPICLKMDMTAGHFSASDRYKYLSELAFDYAFLLDQLGLSKE